MKLLLNITAWGAHVERMWSLMVPSLLAPGNLPALAQRHEVRLDIWTRTKAEYHAILDHPLFDALAKVVTTEANLKDTKDLSRFHQFTINDAVDEMPVAGCIMLSPDAVLADGCLASLSKHIDAGAQAVMIPGPRALLRRGTECLKAFQQGEALVIEPRKLVSLLLSCQHPVTQSLTVNGPLSSTWPSHLYWNVAGEGLLARCLHLHPLFFIPKDAAVGVSIDGEYMNRINPNGEGIVYATSSDEMCAVEFSPWSHMINTVSEEAWSQKSVHDFARRQLPIHCKHAEHTLRLIAGEQGGKAGEQWSAVEDEARRFMEGM